MHIRRLEDKLGIHGSPTCEIFFDKDYQERLSSLCMRLEDLIQGEERAEQVRRAVAALSPDHRIVVTMRFVDGLAYKEISRIVGSPVGTIKSRMHYALAALAEMLGEPFDAAAH